MISDEELRYDHHLSVHEKLGVLTGVSNFDAPWHRRAEYIHALSICDAICDAHLAAIQVGQTCSNSEASKHLVFGVGRRTKFIWLSLRALLRSIPPDRTEPLPHDDVEVAARDLNVIYINMRGSLDNFAWLVLELFGEPSTKELAKKKPQIVNLFGGALFSDAGLREISTLTKPFVDWNKDLKERRDPAAHRIPLSVVPNIVDDAHVEKYQLLLEKWRNACSAAVAAAYSDKNSQKLFEEAELLHDELERVGTFHPLFGHDRVQGLMKIYPLVPEDVGQLVRVCRVVTTFVSNKLASRRSIVSAMRSRGQKVN